MTRVRIILFSIAILATIGIYLLPQYVVEDKKEKVALSEPLESEENHGQVGQDIPENLQATINTYKELMLNSESLEKSAIFADSLAEAFKNGFFFDSAAHYLGLAAREIKSLEAYKKAGDAYFEAFNFAVSESKRNTLGIQAREFYQMVLDSNPKDLDAKANLAVTYVTSAAPMQGIMILRGILEEDPSHELALFNLGLLSITSGQFENAVGRFTTLLENHPDNQEARLYLGYCYLETRETEKARKELESILNSDAEESIKATAQGYLESIN